MGKGFQCHEYLKYVERKTWATGAHIPVVLRPLTWWEEYGDLHLGFLMKALGGGGARSQKQELLLSRFKRTIEWYVFK